jgi:NADH-quinone oxidoreductase subunit J
MTITIQQVIFAVCAILVLAPAIMVVTTKNLFHAALFLILSFLGVAGFYVLLEAGFFAVAQVLIYIGAISILIIFAVMLTRGMQSMVPRNSQAGIAAVLAGIVFLVALAIFKPSASTVDLSGGASIPIIGRVFANTTSRQIGDIPWGYAGEANNISSVSPTSINDFGKALTDTQRYAVPFELASVLILLAMIGAIWVARERRAAEIVAERAEIAAEEAEEQTTPVQQPLPLPIPEGAHAHSD